MLTHSHAIKFQVFAFVGDNFRGNFKIKKKLFLVKIGEVYFLQKNNDSNNNDYMVLFCCCVYEKIKLNFTR